MHFLPSTSTGAALGSGHSTTIPDVIPTHRALIKRFNFILMVFRLMIRLEDRGYCTLNQEQEWVKKYVKTNQNTEPTTRRNSTNDFAGCSFYSNDLCESFEDPHLLYVRNYPWILSNMYAWKIGYFILYWRDLRTKDGDAVHAISGQPLNWRTEYRAWS